MFHSQLPIKVIPPDLKVAISQKWLVPTTGECNITVPPLFALASFLSPKALKTNMLLAIFYFKQYGNREWA